MTARRLSSLSRLSQRRMLSRVEKADAMRLAGDVLGAWTIYLEATRSADPSPSWFARLAAAESSLGHIEASIHHYEQALTLDASVAAWWLALGRLHQRRGKPEDAIVAFERAAECADLAGVAHREQGLALRRLKRWEEAITALELARERVPNDHEVLQALADCYLAREALRPAVQVLKDDLARNGAGNGRPRRLGEVLERLGDWGAAASAYELGRQQGEVDADLLYRLGHAQERAGNLGEAEEAYTQAVRMGDQRPRTYYRLGRVRRKLENWHGAAEAYQAAVDRDGRHARWHHLLGAAHEKSGDHGLAAHAYEAAVLRDPNRARWHHALGRAYGRLERWNQAGEAYARACELDDGNPAWFNDLGVAHQKRKDWRAAAAAFERATALRPANDTWHRRLLAAQDKIELFGPPTYRRPTYFEGILTYMKGELAHRNLYTVGVGSGYVPGSEDDPLIRFLLALGDAPTKHAAHAVLIEPQPERVEGLEDLFSDQPHVRVEPVAIGCEAERLTLYRITEDARRRLLDGGSENDGRRYTSADAELVARRLAEQYGCSDEQAREQIEPFQVPALTLSKVLDMAGYPPHFDVLQIDVQGLDAEVMLSLDLGRYRPRVISYACVEQNVGVRKADSGS